MLPKNTGATSKLKGDEKLLVEIIGTPNFSQGDDHRRLNVSSRTAAGAFFRIQSSMYARVEKLRSICI
jgi:hypothetical protein